MVQMQLMPYPIAKFDQLLRKATCALLPRSAWLSRKTKAGVEITGQNRAGYGGRGFFVFGEELEPELKHLEFFLRPGGVFIDIGANTGVFSMKAARCVESSGEVIAVEPQPDMVYALHRNVLRNDFGNVRIRNCVLSDQSGRKDLWINQDRPASASFNRSDAKAKNLSCLCLTLDELVDLEQSARVDYIKIDTEGSEAAILRGGQRVIAQFKPVIQVEVSVKDVPVMPGYERWHFAGSGNVLQIPAGHWAGQVCVRLGYQQERN
jgi:FkbM family methyltransferase